MTEIDSLTLCLYNHFSTRYYYPLSSFSGDMGGEIGLMLGASLLTFFEFVDLFAFLSYHQLLRLQKRWMKDDQQDLTVAI